MRSIRVQTIVRRKIRGAFAALSRGDAAALLAQMSPDVHHTFPGDHALGAEWANTGTLLDDSTYTNAGAHILRLRWGKLISFHAYLHAAAESAAALIRLAAHGIPEAAAPPITSSPGKPIPATAATTVTT